MQFIAKGRFGQCYAVTLPSKHVVVTKLIQLKSKKQITLAKQEVEVHKRLQHLSICRFLKAFWTKTNVIMVLEYCNDGTLWQAAKRGIYHQSWITQLLKGVVYLHQCCILHRDLKLSNILLKKQHVKISDFGFATEGPFARGLYGTPNYLAPEILNHASYSYGVDVWALGCCLYSLRHYGKGPFERQTLDGTYDAIRALERPADLETLEAKMLVIEANRPSAHEILCTWFNVQPAL